MQQTKERRDPARQTPLTEDAGLFPQDVQRVDLLILPMCYRNKRNDLIVRGVSAGKHCFEVAFAGRRAAMAKPLVRTLAARRAVLVDEHGKINEIDLRKAQLPVSIDGAWRRRFWTGPGGIQHRTHQLVAARWSVPDAKGGMQTYGVDPSHLTVGSPVVGDRRASQGSHIQ